MFFAWNILGSVIIAYYESMVECLGVSILIFGNSFTERYWIKNIEV